MEDNIKVVLRTRPLNKRELSTQCTSLVTCSEADQSVILNCKPEAKKFTFDYVAGEDSTQEQVFRNVGVPLTESCLQGFNGTIIAYGQTGSGKTHTLFGQSGGASATVTTAAGSSESSSDQRGLVPRVFEYLWQKIAAAESGGSSSGSSSSSPTRPHDEDHLETSNTSNISYSCKCSFYEIYNERVLDLLDLSSASSGQSSANGGVGSGLSIREDQKRGVYVDGITEEPVSSPADAAKILALGYRNRHVSSTAMNRDSSRSHAVFLLTVTVTTTSSDTGLKVTNSATFSLVDLAGSERQKATQAEGLRLKEASKINQSLSTLGSVIHALSVGGGPGGSKFIRYRDSALTFLLRDSLGGNSKTVLIAAVSPSSDAMSETLGTLKFAQRAKTVKNVVSANVFANGNVEALQREIRDLRSQLAAAMDLQLHQQMPAHHLLQLPHTSSPTGQAASMSPSSCTSPSSRASAGSRSRSRSRTSPDGQLADDAERGTGSWDSLLGRDAQTGLPTTAAGIVFLSLTDRCLLSDSMQRFAAMDAARVRAEVRAHSLSRQLETSDKAVAALQALTKIDAIVSARLDAASAQLETDAGGSTDAANSLLPLQSAAVDASMAVEVSRLKRKCESLEEKHLLAAAATGSSAYGDNEGCSQGQGQGHVWTAGQEDAFGSKILARLVAAEQSCLLLDATCKQIVQNKFVTEAGLTLAEAKTLQDKCSELLASVEEKETACGQLRIQMLELQQAQASGGNFALAAMGSSARRTATAAIANLSNGHTPEQLSDLEHARLCSDRAGMLADELHHWHTTALTAKVSISTLQKSVHDYQLRLVDAQNTVDKTEEALRGAQSKALQSSRDLQCLAFERDQAQERADTLEILSGSQQAELSEVKSKLAAVAALTNVRGSGVGMMGASGAGAPPPAPSQYLVTETARLQSQVLSEISSREALEAKCTSTLDDLRLSQEVIAELSTKLQVQMQLARERLLQVEDAAVATSDLLVAAADNEEIRKKQAQEITDLQSLLALLQVDSSRQKSAAVEGQTVLTSAGAGAGADKVEKAAAEIGQGNNASSAEVANSLSNANATIRDLRSELLAALQKLEQSAQVRSNLVSCQSELLKVKQLYEASKAAVLEAEQRASAMMAQLIEVSKGMSVPAADTSSSSSSSKSHFAPSTDAAASGGTAAATTAQLGKLERDFKKACAERDASREVLSELEGELDSHKRRLAAAEKAVREVRMENTQLREAQGKDSLALKAAKKDREALLTLQAALKERESKIDQLRAQRDQLRGEIGNTSISTSAAGNTGAGVVRKSSRDVAQQLPPPAPLQQAASENVNVSVRKSSSSHPASADGHRSAGKEKEKEVETEKEKDMLGLGNVSVRRRGLGSRNSSSSASQLPEFGL